VDVVVKTTAVIEAPEPRTSADVTVKAAPVEVIAQLIVVSTEVVAKDWATVTVVPDEQELPVAVRAVENPKFAEDHHF
jgi:GTP cyclohydrolase FolE2